MKIFLILCLASGLAYSDKLDRSYLPPPGSKFSGGRPGDIDVPLEFPKQPAGQPQLQNGKPEIELGINRRPAPAGTQDSQKPGFTYFQKSYPVPKTTTSYAITQTTTFPTDSELDQPNIFVNGSNVPGVEGQNYQPNREQVPSYNQYRPGVSQSTAAPYGTTARPPFPNKFNGPQYLPPVSNKQSPGGVISNQDGSSYPSDLPQHQHGEADSVKRPGFTPFDQQNQFGNENVPSTVASQYHDRFRPTGFGSQGTQKQFPGNQFASSTTAPQYQLGQTFKTPGASQQNQFLGNQDFPSSTSAPQYQGGQRLTTPGSHQENQFPGSQDFAPSTTAPQFQTGQGFTPGLNQQVFGSRVPTQQNQYPGSRYEVNQFPSSTLAPEYQAGQSFTTPGISPTPGSIQNLYSGNQNYPSTAAPDYQDGQRVTPGQIQGGLSPGQRPFSSRLPSHNKYPGQNIPPSTIAPQFQDNESLTTPGYIQEGYKSSVPSHHNQYQYPGTQNVLPSTTAPQYQTGQQFTTGPGGQNIPTTAAPTYDNGQRFSTPGQYQGQLVPEQQFGAPNQPGSNQFVGNRNYPSPTIGSQYQDNNRLSTPGSQQRFESPQQNQNGNQNFPTSTATPQSFSTPGQIVNQPSYPGSTTAPQYQQNFAPALGTNQAVPNQQSQYQRPVYNQQIPSSTATPQGFIPGSQPQYNNLPSPGTEVSFPQQVLPGSQQPASQPEAGSSIYGPAPTFSNPKFPSSGIETSPTRDFASRPGSATITGSRPERPQAEGDRNAEILNYENVLTPEGYYYRYDTSNGIHADETGVVGNGTRAQGGYTYTGDDGKVYSVVYTADENGFQPRGDHLPTPPPIPEAIQRVIDQANLDREAGTDDDGSYNEEKYGYMKYEGPVTGLRPKNRTESLVHGAHIPETSEDGIEGQNRRVLNSKGRRPGLKPSSIDGIETEDTDIDDSDFEEIPKNRGGLRDDDSLIDNKEVNRRPSSKRPKPVKTLTVQDNRPDRLKGSKTSMKPTINSKKNGSNRIQISTEEYDDSAPNDSSEELDDDEDQQDSDGFDVDSDQVNYTDDPNNRTDFHGLNKYLPESKKSNRKNQSGKKRPSMRINKPVAGVSDPERNEDDNSEQLLYTKPSFVDSSRTRIPSRKNKLGQKVSGQPKITGQTVPLNSDDETNTYDDDKSDINENYDSDDATKPSANNRKHKPTMFDSKNKLSSKPKRPTANQKGDSNNKENESSSHEETGYEYTPPQRQFGSEDVMNFPSRTNQKGAQTTVRPFLTKNVYGDENEPTDVYIDQYGNSKPGRPVAHGNYPGDYQGGDNNDQNAVNENEGFSTTRKPGSSGIYRPSGRPQTTGTPQYQPGVTGQEGLYQNNPELHQNQGFSTTRRPTYGTSQRPFGRPQSTVSPQYQEQSVTGQQGDIYQNNSEVNQNQGFSTTRRPTYGTSQRPFGRPQSTVSPQYQDQGVTGQQGNIYQNNPEVNQNQGFSTTRRPSYGTSQRPFGRPQTSAPQYQDQLTGQVYVSNQGPQTPGDKLYYNTNTPNRGTVGNVFSTTTPLPPSGPDSSNYQPGQYQNVPDGSHYETTSPSQTSRLGQVPSTTYRPNYNFGDKISSVTVDASGQPIQTTTAPTFDHTVRPTYSVRPEDPNQGVPFKPNVGRFGVNGAPGYQSTSAPIGEDFSGPKQPQRFDPETGYHYK